MQPYAKKACTTQQHLALWQQRGLAIGDPDVAAAHLDRIGYYRLSAYTCPFRLPGLEQFRQGTTFAHIQDLYCFDEQLRLLLLEALSNIEIAVRSALSNHMAVRLQNPFWYLDPQHFKRDYDHAQLLAVVRDKIGKETGRLNRDRQQVRQRNLSAEAQARLMAQIEKENFLRHYIAKGYQPPEPPSWMMIELLTWGDLSHLYAGLSLAADRKAIARRLGTEAVLLASWLRALNHLRNLCAHHERIWNREFGVSPKIPTSAHVPWPICTVETQSTRESCRRRVYVFIAVLAVLNKSLPDPDGWKSRLFSLLGRRSASELLSMGIEANWRRDPFWNVASSSTKEPSHVHSQLG